MKHNVLRHVLHFTSGALICATLLTSTSPPTFPAYGGTEIRQETDGAGDKNSRIGDRTDEGDPSEPKVPEKGNENGNRPKITPQSDDYDDIDCCTA